MKRLTKHILSPNAVALVLKNVGSLQRYLKKYVRESLVPLLFVEIYGGYF
jgi:hypothetical protein